MMHYAPLVPIFCRLPFNTSKNRYKDVICYDDSRVVLKTQHGKDGSDYIHANYVDGFKKPNAFILTQGIAYGYSLFDWELSPHTCFYVRL